MKNILITGGGFHNKGAQAMTFIAISELSVRFPNHQLIVISDKDVCLMDNQDYPYRFLIMGTEICIPYGCYLLGGIPKLYAVRHGVRKKDVYPAKEIWENVEYVIDISGYALGSNWGIRTSLLTALWSELAEKYQAKMIYMPQSFGPFNYKGLRGMLADYYIGKCLKKADCIYAREESGMKLLQEKYNLTNVRLSSDLVLQNKEIFLDTIYNTIPELCNIEVKENSVGVIPNTEIIKYMDKEEVLSLYKSIISQLLLQNFTVYILSHARNDKEFCREIKKMYKDDERVIEIQNDLSCVEFEKLVSKFNFLIASRYHSVVHAYRKSIPCIVIGWANKYEELAKLCEQEEFTLNVRDGIDSSEVIRTIENMVRNVKANSDSIRYNVEIVQKSNVFDCLSEKR